MQSRTEANPIDLLQGRLRADWSAIKNARESAIQKRTKLRADLASLDSEDTSIVVFGSLARDEFTSGSDIDWALLVDGQANPEHLDSALEIGRYIREVEKRPPGREATFGGLMFSHDLIHRIGGADDTNKNTTQRILLLLESAVIGRSEAYERVLKNVLWRYISEDYGLITGFAPFNVPRFLQNDIARYWRTVAVDFAYKQRQRADEGWALRTAKLRISRKLTYVSGLLVCFSCQTENNQLNGQGSDSDLHPLVEHLRKYSQQTPLEILANVLLAHPQMDALAKRLFDTYDDFLAQLDNAETRDHLENLDRNESATDERYKYVRELSHTFQDGLTELFLEDNVTKLWELTKVYGVF